MKVHGENGTQTCREDEVGNGLCREAVRRRDCQHVGVWQFGLIDLTHIMMDERSYHFDCYSLSVGHTKRGRGIVALIDQRLG